MFFLANSIKKTLSIADGWQVGRLIIENETFIELDNGEVIEVTDDHKIEVLNGEQWEELRKEDFEAKTVEGWPLFAGFDVRFKTLEEGESN